MLVNNRFFYFNNITLIMFEFCMFTVYYYILQLLFLCLYIFCSFYYILIRHFRVWSAALSIYCRSESHSIHVYPIIGTIPKTLYNVFTYSLCYTQSDNINNNDTFILDTTIFRRPNEKFKDVCLFQNNITYNCNNKCLVNES